MLKISRLISSMLILMALCINQISTSFAGSPALPSQILALNKEAQYHKLESEQGTAHIVYIPANASYSIEPQITGGLKGIEEFVEKYPQSIIINGGYFDPMNQKTASYVTIKEKVKADPTKNKRLTKNKNLEPYLDKIFNRSEFRVYQCGNTNLTGSPTCKKLASGEL